VLGRDPVVAQDPTSLETVLVSATHPVFLPGETHRKAVNREVDVGDEGTLFDLGTVMALGTPNVRNNLFDAQFDLTGTTFVVHHAHVFQANKRLEDFARVSQDEGAFSFLGHT
jgi:hypothetical protein